MKTLAIGAILTTIATVSLAMDSGPRVVGCEWATRAGHSDVDICLIVAQGQFSGGVSLTAVRVGNRPEMYLFEDNRARLFEGSSVDTKKLWEGRVRVEEAQCRPAGKLATRFTISDGTVLCLYGD
jgi:hypothetical protein